MCCSRRRQLRLHQWKIVPYHFVDGTAAEAQRRSATSQRIGTGSWEVNVIVAVAHAIGRAAISAGYAHGHANSSRRLQGAVV